MGWRTVVIENGAHLRCEHHQLVIKQGEQEAQLPVEDLDAVVVDSPQVTLTTPLLRELASAGAILVVCDEKHLPCGIYLPQHQHFRGGAVVDLQLAATQPFVKRLWQRLIVAKIVNQATVVTNTMPEGAVRLRNLTRKVTSGDSKNVEAQAAKAYWKLLFGEQFSRSVDSNRNAALNYGYAIVRSALARAVTQRGLLPVLGLFHRNTLNPFCLVDDLLEPFRPFVDREVAALLPEDNPFDKPIRNRLVALVHQQVLMGGEQMNIGCAATECASSLVRALKEKKPELLVVPEFVVGPANTVETI